ncbi:MAG TPA: TonB-dependent receptor [Bryobacteraceae bacterium]|nr:TonB-dependent receptor [Bryobacteraceae bacterium]
MNRRLGLLLICCGLPLAAQNSSLNGVITDARAAVVPAASITIQNEDTTASRATLSNDRGEYSVVQVPPGKYRVTVEKPGFNVQATEVVLQTNTPATLNLTLEVGAVSQTVSVTAEAAAVNTENASMGNPFTEIQVKEIPLQTRNIVALLGVQPGVASTGQVLGARADQNNVMLDGVDVNDNAGANGFNSVLPIPLDSVQEFRTTVAGLGADQGRSGGGQVSIVTKSGSNQFHGTAYEYNRNTDLAANSWFSNRAGVPRAALIRNQYGASLGGPILKNKLFFFYNWEGRKDRSATPVTRLVPSATLQQGIIQVPLKGGPTVSLSPSDIANIDPLHIGESPYMASYLKSFPAGNNPLASPDLGLNFNELTFNAPQDLNNHAQVAKLDYNIDSSGKHTISLRGTLNGAAVDGNGQTGSSTGLAEFPGQAAVQRTLDNSRGLSGRYTAVLTPNLVNVFNYGYTRLGNAATGTEAVVPTFYFAGVIGTTRPTQRIAPTTNVTDDMTWTKGRHTIQYGLNFRFALNTNQNFNNVPNYSFSRNTLLGLGGDITTDVMNYLAPTYGSGVALASATNVTNAFGPVLGLINQYGATYNYTVQGSPIAFGNPVTTSFADHEYEGYIQDAFKWKHNLTITVGLRYSLSGVPYDVNGREVTPLVSANQFFGDRLYAANNGIPNSQLTNSLITYGLGGPVNGRAGYYPADTKDFGPRLAAAYSPKAGSTAEKIMGAGSVFRVGAALLYDHYGTAMAQQFASSGSPGLATAVAQPINTNFTTGYRYTGGAYPTLPTVAGGSFPLTPAIITGGFTTFSGVSSDLKAPYQYLLNTSYARSLPKKMTIEVGYVGRLGHRGIIQQDFGQPLTNFKDPASGQTFAAAGAPLTALFNSGLTAAQVKANPTLVPNEAFYNNMFPGLANHYIPGSASANFFYDVYGNYAGSWLDGLNDVDRIRQPNGSCIVITGCNTFFPLQNSGLDAFTNNGRSSYHAMTIVLRRAVQSGWGYDFNYTWGHAIDNGSASESAENATSAAANASGTSAYSTGGLLQDAFNTNAFRGPSDFDSRQTFTADAVVEIPVGKGKMLFGSAPGWVNQIIGGWQGTTLISFHSGTPLTVSDAGDYNVNYDIAAFGVLAPGAKLPANGVTLDSNGIPSIFSSPNAVNSFVGAGPGTVGTRGIVRSSHFFNTDLALSKSFILPWEHQKISFRAEAFNAFNGVNFGVPNLSLATPTTFGEITGYAFGAAPRVMQMALRYEF